MSEADGAGAARRAVAQSAVIAVQDAVDALRNATTLATAASGAALAQFLASGDPRYLEALTASSAMVESAIASYSATLAASAEIIEMSAPAD